MNMLNRLLNKFKKRNKPLAIKKRGYAGASTGRLFSSWTTTNQSADSSIESGLNTMRARSRDLAMNSDYARRFFKLVVTNVVGWNGIKLQSKAKDPTRRLDKKANDMIEDSFAKWSKSENASLDRQLSWGEIQKLVIESVARDGEVIVRMIRAPINEFGFALEVIEADHLDVNYNDQDRKIRMSIQYDGLGRPIKYWMYKQHPGDSQVTTAKFSDREAVDAKDIIHLYNKERPSQSRGVPWIHSAMTRINNLDGYEEAEIVAARVGASQMGIYTSNDGDAPIGDEDSDGDTVFEVEPGIFGKAPEGYDLKMFDPKHPAGNFDPFMKRTLMGIAAGMGVAYNSLANDLESVNYSSIRAGSLEERSYWKNIQSWFIDNFLSVVYSNWLEMALTMHQTKLPLSKFDKYNNPHWFPRSWDWVDPIKDSRAAIEEIDAGIRTRSDVLAEKGKDFEDIVESIALENEMLKAAGVDLKKEKPAKQNTKKEDKEDDEDNG